MLVFVSSALDTSAATTILSALAVRRGSQVVRSRSAKPLFAGSIPAPASRSRSVSLNNEISFHAPVRLIRRRPTAHPYGLRLCRSAPAGSIPAPASRSRSVSLNNEISLHAPVRLVRCRPTAHPYGLRPMSLGSPPAPFPPPPI